MNKYLLLFNSEYYENNYQHATNIKNGLVVDEPQEQLFVTGSYDDYDVALLFQNKLDDKSYTDSILTGSVCCYRLVNTISITDTRWKRSENGYSIIVKQSEVIPFYTPEGRHL
jgi:hypothetical protein